MNDWINSPLIKAASEGELEEVRVLLREGADVEARGGLGTTALSFAAFEGHVSVVEYLIGYGADANALGYEDCPPLGLAAYNGKIETMRLLLKGEAEIEGVRPSTGETALHFAVLKRQTEAVRLLLASGANLEARTNGGAESDSLRELRLESQTPLHLAAAYSDAAIVKLLLENGADIHAVDGLGRTPLDLARLPTGREEVAGMLEQQLKRFSKDFSETPGYWLRPGGFNRELF